MKYGFIKVAAASPALRVADCRYNAERAAEMMQQAAAAGAHLLVLPELGLTGYTCGDLLLQPTLQQGALSALQTLLSVSAELPLTTITGLPLSVEGKLYNCAAVLHQGQILGVVPKTNLPNYGEFYEARWFTPAPAGTRTISLLGQEVPFGTDLLFCCRELPEYKLAVEICEDLWVAAPPSTRHAIAGATVLANCSASDETIGKAEYRRSLVTGQSARLMAGYLYADAGRGESTTDMVFAGHNLIAENGKLLAQTALFTNEMAITELDVYRLAAERRRTTTWPTAEAAGYTVIPFSLPVSETSLTRFIDPHPFVPADSTERWERCEAILAMQRDCAVGWSTSAAPPRCWASPAGWIPPWPCWSRFARWICWAVPAPIWSPSPCRASAPPAVPAPMLKFFVKSWGSPCVPFPLRRPSASISRISATMKR